MFAHTRRSATSFTTLISFALTYALFISLCAPFVMRKAEAAAPRDRKEKRGSKRTATASQPVRSATQGNKRGQREGELLVRFRQQSSEQERTDTAGRHGARRARKLKGESSIEKLEVQTGQDLSAVAAALRLDPTVEYVEPNYLISRDQTTPNDSRFNEQWALRNTGATGGQPGADISATGAWSRTTGAATTVIAVVDSGIDFTHPDLKNNQWTNGGERDNNNDDDRNGYTDDTNGWDWIADSGTIKDEQGHGTAMAGIIAAEGNNSQGTTGVMWRASLMSLRVLDNTGTGDIADAVEAIDYAVAKGASVINCSWGTDEESLILKDAIDRAGRSGVVVVTSAGNDSRDIEAQPYYPASFNLSNLIAVASTDNFDRLASWSNYGATHVSVAAPGTDILTTRMNGGYFVMSGTSASAPLVSGIAGLIKTERSWLSASGTRAAIIDGARRLGELNGKVTSGGVASAAGALGALQSPGTPQPSPSPGGGSGNGNGQGGGNGQGRTPPVPPGGPPHGRGRSDEFRRTPPNVTRGAFAGMPNLDEARRKQPTAPRAPSPIRANLINCPRTDPSYPDCDYTYGEPGSTDPNFSTPRTEPRNQTGQPGVDLGSRNFNWSTGLVSLPGRAGLDLNIGLSYNSLVWTRNNSTMRFNADTGFPGPGFHLGFPEIQQRYYNSQIGVYAYMLITPSGGRVELRQVNSNTYEAADGSHMQMTDYGGGSALVRTSDGTQLTFSPSVQGEMRCTQIKDRNGNFITISYDGDGRITQVMDTLARVVTFNYGTQGELLSITQPWGGQTHTWASFGYGDLYVQTNFRDVYGNPLTINGPNNATVRVLTQVGFADGSRYNFSYNPYGQAYRITRSAKDNTQLSYANYNLPLDTSAAQSDCPRFTERRDWVWRGVMNESAEVATTYSVAGDGSWTQMTMPDGTVHKEFFDTSGTWRKGLTIRTETFSSDNLTTPKKATTIAWTQDNEGLTYQLNPRPVETNITDEVGNRRKTTVSYLPPSQFSLPSDVREWGGADASTVLRRTHTDYRFDAAYVDRRIIGLPAVRYTYEGESGLVSMLEYHYDWDGEYLQGQAPSMQHQNVGYIIGRGNLVAMRRFNTSAPGDPNQAMWLEGIGYNMAGSVVFKVDGAGHRTNIAYADSFSDGNNGRNTLAYPTTVTDPDGYSATAQYNFDFGAVTRRQTPLPNQTGNQLGPVETMLYDDAGRILRVTSGVNNAYTRWVYPDEGTYVQSFTTVQAGAAEAYAAQMFDGVGRLRAVAGDHPGSTGGWRAVVHLNDVMGRRVQTTNPTEINTLWVPVGDDATGWVLTEQTYDWQGRPLLTTNPDGTTSEARYGGCGCAGGEQTTVRDEAGRFRRLTKDVLGRLQRVEEMTSETSVYATTTYSYNWRDQLTGIDQSGRTRSFEYDGHGRLWRRTTPEQGATTFAYNADDTTQSTTDARGATATFTYNNRHLVTNIAYAGGSGVAYTSPVSFTYDAAGNRTRMTDGQGYVDYSYDQLSSLEWEQRTFNGVGAYRLTYAYNLAGQLTGVTNPWGVQVGYTRDHTGQVTAVTGANYAGVSTYANNLQYRAFGAVKSESYGSGRQLQQTFDTRLRLKTWQVAGVMSWEYSYQHFGENTGRVTYAKNLYDGTLDRAYQYDRLGRLINSFTGSSARAHTGEPGGAWTGDGPYAVDSVSYDVWGNLTARAGWGGENMSYTAQFDAKNQRAGSSYDTAGNIISDGGQSFQYDATGQQTYAAHTALEQGYDGDRMRVKKTENSQTTLYLRSSVLGNQVVAELTWNWQYGWSWYRGYVYGGGGELLAIQDGGVRWVHADPVTKSQRVTDGQGGVISWIDLDPWGSVTGRSVNTQYQPRKYTTYERDANSSDEAMHRRYNRWWQRFDQPDPYDGSYDLSDPQSFNRYAYVANDPVNFVDPSGLLRLVEKPDLSGLWSLIWGRMELERQLEMPEGSSISEPVLEPVLPQNPTPQGPAPGQKLSESDCEKRLAALLGGPGAVASTQREPGLIDSKRAGSLRFPEHSATAGIIHLYGNEQGTAPPNSVGLYAPAGFRAVPGGRGERLNPPGGVNPGQVNYNYAQYRNSAGVTISFVHIGPPVGDPRNAAGSTLVGSIAGPGGAGYGYNHTHINFYLNGKRVDPRSIFCK